MVVADLTLAEMRLALAPAVAAAAVFDGWTDAAVDAAANVHGVAPATARLAFGGGAMDRIGAWIERIDADMAAALPAERIGNLSMRERIRTLLQFRLDALAGYEEALRRALSIVAMPQNAAATAQRSWRSADVMWRLAGDRAADFNHYTKRITLAGIYTATLLVFANDSSEGKADTHAFLARRIDGVMRFEKLKAQVLRPHDDRFSLTRFLGRLRYPAR